MVSLPFPWHHSFGIWDMGATTSMSGFQGLEAIRDSHLTSGMKDSFEIDMISCTFANGESQTSNSRVTFSMFVTSQISVGLHVNCFWTTSTDTLWSGCCASSGRDTHAKGSKVYSRGHQVYLPTTTLPGGHAACLTGRAHC